MEESFGTGSKQKNRVDNNAALKTSGSWKDNQFGWKRNKQNVHNSQSKVSWNLLWIYFAWILLTAYLTCLVDFYAVLHACIASKCNCLESGMNSLGLKLYCVIGTYWLIFLKSKDLLLFHSGLFFGQQKQREEVSLGSRKLWWKWVTVVWQLDIWFSN